MFVGDDAGEKKGIEGAWGRGGTKCAEGVVEHTGLAEEDDGVGEVTGDGFFGR